MKKIILFSIFLAAAIASATAAHLFPATGRVVDDEGKAVEFATVVLLRGEEQVVGMATDEGGRFRLDVPSGEYTLSVQYLGYDPVRRTVRVEERNDLGDIVLRNAATAIEGVVVKAQLIRREADRFIVDVANAPSAIGKDGIELLERAPGVWIDKDKISINGKTGSKVWINDRELRMEPEQLISYLRSLRAEQIQKIEVVPLAGADQDASASSGIIRITLKKRRENGVEGSLSIRTDQGRLSNTYSPGGNVSYHVGRLDVNASAWSWLGKTTILTDENTRYTASDKTLRAASEMIEHDYTGGGTLGAIYELSDRHSLGAEFSYYHGSEETGNSSRTDLEAETALTSLSRYDGYNLANGYEGTANYIWKIDTLGSTLKVLGDLAYRRTRIGNDNLSRLMEQQRVRDSLYRDNTLSSFTIAALTLALEKKFSPRWTLKAGAKYTFNDMRNDALYEFRQDDAWQRNDNQSFRIDYTEHIGAAYGIVSASLGRVSLVAGLRGEYTYTQGKTGDVSQRYFSLFPNANLSWALSKDGAYALVAQYARTISRPNFWHLTPRRMQLSDYTYQIGNPGLDPSYKHDVSLTMVMGHKYTLTGGVLFQTGEIEQVMQPDPQNPDLLCVAWVNFDSTRSYYLTANLPFQLTPWWQLNLSGNYIRQGRRPNVHAAETFQNVLYAGGSTTFTLPLNFFIDLSYRYQSRIEFGNCWVEPMHFLHAGVKKRFGERFTLSVEGRNLTGRPQHVGATGDGFVRLVDMAQPWSGRQLRIGLTYNFKSGKAFKRKTVEAGSAGEKSRM